MNNSSDGPVFVPGNPNPRPLTQEQKDRVKKMDAERGTIEPLPDEAYIAAGLKPPVCGAMEPITGTVCIRKRWHDGLHSGDRASSSAIPWAD